MTDGVPVSCSEVAEKDLLSAYVEGKLDVEQAEALERHYFGCDRCWADLQTAIEARAAIGKAATTARRPPANRWVFFAAAAMVALAGVAALILLRRPNEDAPLADLIRSSEGPRRVAGRLGSFPYAPPAPVTRGARDDIPAKTRAAAHRALGIETGHANAATRHAAGIAHLLLGETDAAIQELEAAHGLAPSDPAIESDLAAAYHERFRVSESPADREKALAAVEGALQSKPDFAPALFNRALIVESAHVSDEAVKAWNAFLAVEPAGPWADEARRRIGSLRKAASRREWKSIRDELERSPERFDAAAFDALARDYPQDLRFWVSDQALPAWAAGIVGGRDQDARARLRLAVDASAAWTRRTGDPLLSDTLRQVVSEPNLTTTLGRAFSSYGRARELYAASATTGALEAMRSSHSWFVEARSPFACMAGLYEIAFLSISGDPSSGREHFRRLTCQGKSASLSAFRNWVDALLLSSEGRFEQALQRDMDALPLFERLGETENVASAHSLIAQYLTDLGQTAEAWRHRDAALRALVQNPNAFRFHPILSEAARAASSENLSRTARFWLDELIARARRQGNDTLAVEAYAWRASALDRLDPTLGRTGLREAHALAARISDEGARKTSEAELDLVEGELLQSREPAEAVRLLDGLIPVLERGGNRSQLPACHLARGRALRTLGRRDLAEKEFRSGIEIIEQERELADSTHRLEFFQKAQALFDELMVVLSESGRESEAFAFSERSRCRTLLDAPIEAVQPAVLPLTSLGQVARRLPTGTELVEFAVLPDRVLTWYVSRDHQTMRTMLVESGQVDRLVDVLEDAAVHGVSERFDRSTAELGRLLLSGDDLDHATTLVFVPDKALWRVPFAALRLPQGGPLGDLAVVAAAPSASFFLGGSRNVPSPRAREWSALVVGASRGDPRFGLPALPRAEGEARLVAALLPHAHILAGADATRQHFFDLASSSSLIHFAGHAVTRPASPGASTLRFNSRDANDDGVVYLSEIAKARFGATRLIVLSGCTTAAGPVSGREGPISFCRAFLQAGVPAALGSLWDVDDAEAESFLAVFYSGLSRGATPAAALREAQRNPRSARDLSRHAFEVYCNVNGLRERVLPPEEER